MNNCVGVRNLKHFFLFLVYTLATCMYALGLFLRHFIQCELGKCRAYSNLDTNLVRVAMVLAFAGTLFTFSMLLNQVGGVLSGVGTVDRMQRRKKDRMTNAPAESDDRPVPWVDVFGAGNRLLWLLPTDPRFENWERVMGYDVPR
ncbi:unnamed protein product, partial [Phaeothamnion confervicola]